VTNISEAAWFNARLDEYLTVFDDCECAGDGCDGCEECAP
jgi:hypothetical protein